MLVPEGGLPQERVVCPTPPPAAVNRMTRASENITFSYGR